MRIIMAEKQTEKRKIKTAKVGEAFRYGSQWYTRISITDNIISNFEDFCTEHTTIEELLYPYPVLHLGAQAFYYLNGELEADE